MVSQGCPIQPSKKKKKNLGWSLPTENFYPLRSNLFPRTNKKLELFHTLPAFLSPPDLTFPVGQKIWGLSVCLMFNQLSLLGMFPLWRGSNSGIFLSPFFFLSLSFWEGVAGKKGVGVGGAKSRSLVAGDAGGCERGGHARLSLSVSCMQEEMCRAAL